MAMIRIPIERKDDLVRAVRCKDCKYMDDEECCTRYADEGAIHSTLPYGYCWVGERREDEEA